MANNPVSPIAGYKDVNEFTQRALQCILQATKKSNDLPMAGDDFDYFSSFSNFQELMNVEGQRILHMMQNILRYETVRGDRSLTTESLDVDDKFDYLTDANDQILERISNSLDEASGIRKQEKLIVVNTNKPGTTTSWNKQSAKSSPRNYSLFTARNIERPQLKFKDTVKNDNLPFCPALKDKPNALRPLAESMELPADITDDVISSPYFEYPHPYRYELEHFVPLSSQTEKVSPNVPAKCSESPTLTMVESPQELDALIDELMNEKEVAVDLEHHSYRSFLGFTCLMQVSTRRRDYIIDAITLRPHLHRLNRVFTHPSILKVFHGADSDVEWMQRDFSLYLVNLFDTCVAARLLNYGRLSLAFLLEKFCGVHANKQYQLADWRIRPLPTELLAYAREDTHYLLYIHDCLTNELIKRSNEQNNLIHSLHHLSTQLCLKKYKKPKFTDSSHLDLYRKSRKVFNAQQLYALRELYSWKDQMARSEDESSGYILPTHMLLQMSEILPREQTGVLACCNPVPPLVRQSLNEIHAIVLRARDVTVNATQPPRKSPQKTMTSPVYVRDVLTCRHDNTPRSTLTRGRSQADRNDGLVPVKSSSRLLSGESEIKTFGTHLLIKPSPLLAALTADMTRCRTRELRDLADNIRGSFVSPCEMYLPVAETNAVRPPKDRRPAMPKSAPLPTLAAPSTTQWKLKKSGKKRKSEDASMKIIAEDAEPSSSGATIQANVIPETDGVVSLSQMLPHKKKKKKKVDWAEIAASEVALDDADTSRAVLGDTQQSSDTVPVSAGSGNKADKGKKGDKKRDRNEEVDVTPFDYSQVDMSMFSKGGAHKKKVFDPRDKSKKHKKSSKSKMFKKDFRSQTFKPKK